MATESTRIFLRLNYRLTSYIL